jgi:hypothetical protein
VEWIGFDLNYGIIYHLFEGTEGTCRKTCQAGIWTQIWNPGSLEYKGVLTTRLQCLVPSIVPSLLILPHFHRLYIGWALITYLQYKNCILHLWCQLWNSNTCIFFCILLQHNSGGTIHLEIKLGTIQGTILLKNRSSVTTYNSALKARRNLRKKQN